MTDEEGLKTPVKAMAAYKQPDEIEVTKCKHRKHLDLAKVISAHKLIIGHILFELDAIEAVIGKKKMCEIRKKLGKVKAQENFLEKEKRELEKLRKELEDD